MSVGFNTQLPRRIDWPVSKHSLSRYGTERPSPAVGPVTFPTLPMPPPPSSHHSALHLAISPSYPDGTIPVSAGHPGHGTSFAFFRIRSTGPGSICVYTWRAFAGFGSRFNKRPGYKSQSVWMPMTELNDQREQWRESLIVQTVTLAL